jgi:hypothetical protein
MMPGRPQEKSFLRASAAWLVLAALGCVDPDGRYDAFIERTADMRRGEDAGRVEPGERFDFSGQYLLALSTTIAPGQPILFACDVSVAADLETLELSIQALTTDADPAPRTETGDPLEVAAVPYAEDGSFDADLGEVTVPGNANPISGSDIVATVAITATAHPMNELPMYFCGDATGMATVPLELDLAGSTLGAVETESFTDAEPLAACPGSSEL